jgi:hypothetical protein
MSALPEKGAKRVKNLCLVAQRGNAGPPPLV